MAKELAYLQGALEDPERPFVAILGGAKISGKIEVIDALVPKVDEILIGGAMACTFFAAQGLEMGNSLVEEDRLDLARKLLDRAGEKLVLPRGVTIAERLEEGARYRQVPPDQVKPGWAVYDVDESTTQDFIRRINAARTVVWNGPMGVFETPPFDAGTVAIARGMAQAADAGVTTIVGGGDSVAALQRTGLSDRMTHVSTGGGASLELLEGKELPGVAALDDA
jgi:phosphoglycerate kinase